MKTPISTTQFFSRKFQVVGNQVSLAPSIYRGEPQVPTVVIVHSSFPPLSAKLQVWAELTHYKGASDPVGHDCLWVHLDLSMRTTWIRCPAQELLTTECHSAGALYKWLTTTKKALLAGVAFAPISGSISGKVEWIFPPLFDAVSALHQHLTEAYIVRNVLWVTRDAKLSEHSVHPRFKLRFN